MSPDQETYVYVMEYRGGARSTPGPSKVGVTNCLPRRLQQVRRFVRYGGVFYDYHGQRRFHSCDLYWAAKVPSRGIALKVEKFTKMAAAPAFGNLQDWVDMEPEKLADLANFFTYALMRP